MSAIVTPNLETPVEPQPEVPVVEAPPAPVEKRYSYQPTDESGRPLGGPQVIVYTTEQELVDKMTKNSIELIRKLRTVTRENRLGKFQAESLPDDLDKLPVSVQFSEKELTPEERYLISQDLNDPEKFSEARDKLLESAIGVPPSQLRDTLNQQQMTTQQLLARQNALVWMERHPEFFQCPENINTVCDWMVKNGLQPTVKNFEYAQIKMEEAGLLLQSPIVREVPPESKTSEADTVPKPQVPAVEPTRISAPELPQENRQSHVPSGLNNRVASNTGVPSVPSGLEALTLGAIDKMSSDEYKRNLMNPAFVKRVDELEATRPPKPRR